jgi:hypothetical protein
MLSRALNLTDHLTDDTIENLAWTSESEVPTPRPSIQLHVEYLEPSKASPLLFPPLLQVVAFDHDTQSRR